MSATEDKELALGIASDLAVNFMAYDRKDNEDLSRDKLEGLIASGILSKEEIVDAFAARLGEEIDQLIEEDS